MSNLSSNSKIICIGFHKTATTTLGVALEKLGLKVKDITPRALIPILKGDYDKVAAMVKNHDAMQDTPWFMIYKELDNRYPGSKFILTIREEDLWFNSIVKQIGTKKNPLWEWIYGRGYGLPQANEQLWRNKYNAHNKEVQDYFRDRPDDLLIIDITRGDGWEKICPFLSKDIPNEEFPHSNSSKVRMAQKPTFKSKFQQWRRRQKNHFKIWWIDVRGLWK